MIKGFFFVEISDSDYGPMVSQSSSNKARQKKFMKTFSQLPPEEVVLQSKD